MISMKMHYLVQIFTSAALILSVFSYPRPNYYCNNWCYRDTGNVCCDFGYYGGHNQFNPDIMSSKTYCPLANCTAGATVLSAECTSDDDCKRKEMCCENPCFSGKKSCVEHVKKNPIVAGCKAITNCEDWLKMNETPVLCKDDDDCKRSETCCSVPCKSDKVCQKTEASSTGTRTAIGTGTGTVYCPNSNYCY